MNRLTSSHVKDYLSHLLASTCICSGISSGIGRDCQGRKLYAYERGASRDGGKENIVVITPVTLQLVEQD
jgi:hypothetical protein